MNEQIVLVDPAGKVIGRAPKLTSHHGKTPLHLAFSCYIFNPAGQLLLTRRAAVKKVWPGVWTNSVCGHPAPEETTQAAISRRANYELGITQLSNITLLLPDYRYKTPPFKGIVENEVCPVYAAISSQDPAPNPAEVDGFRWQELPLVERAIKKNPADYSYWFKDQLNHLALNKSFKKFARG